MRRFSQAIVRLCHALWIAAAFIAAGCGGPDAKPQGKAPSTLDLHPKTAEGQLELGYKYYLGDGLPIHHERAAALFKQAAEQGHAEAQFALGVCAQNGYGVPMNYLEAAKWYLKSARQDNPNGQYLMGLACKEGSGVSKNIVEAYKWLHLAAEKGQPVHIEARDQLALLLTPDLVAEGKRRAEQFRIYESTPQSLAGSAPRTTPDPAPPRPNN